MCNLGCSESVRWPPRLRPPQIGYVGFLQAFTARLNAELWHKNCKYRPLEVNEVSQESRVQPDYEDEERPPQDDPTRTPDTPTDEPKPAPVQDPPAEPG